MYQEGGDCHPDHVTHTSQASGAQEAKENPQHSKGEENSLQKDGFRYEMDSS